MLAPRPAFPAAALCAVVLAGCAGGGEQAVREPADTAAAPAPGVQTENGELIYGRVCVTCHQANGEGIPETFPPLAGSAVTTGDPAVAIRIVLHGLTGPMTRGGRSYNGLMTPWGDALTDQDVADVLTFVRGGFGNTAEAVSPGAVAREREATASQSSPFTTEDLGIVH